MISAGFLPCGSRTRMKRTPPHPLHESLHPRGGLKRHFDAFWTRSESSTVWMPSISERPCSSTWVRLTQTVRLLTMLSRSEAGEPAQPASSGCRILSPRSQTRIFRSHVTFLARVNLTRDRSGVAWFDFPIHSSLWMNDSSTCTVTLSPPIP